MKRYIFTVFFLILCLKLEAHGLTYLKEDLRNQAMCIMGTVSFIFYVSLATLINTFFREKKEGGTSSD